LLEVVNIDHTHNTKVKLPSPSSTGHSLQGEPLHRKNTNDEARKDSAVADKSDIYQFASKMTSYIEES
jgi:hypothetical protein